MVKVLLGCLVSKVPNDVLTCYKALLDFIYLAQYPSHDDDTLEYMEAALTLFHKHKEVFISLGIQDHFNMLKFHSLLHYIECIKQYSTTDNYNMEAFEHLHIDLVKEDWCVSNTRNLIPQMTRWLDRQDQIAMFQQYIDHPLEENLFSWAMRIVLAKHPTIHAQLIWMIEELHSVPHFSKDLKHFLNSLLPPGQAITCAATACLNILDIWHSYKLQMDKLGNDVDVQEGMETIKAKPGEGSRFDTVMVAHSTAAESTGLQVIFKLPTKISLSDAPCTWPKEELAYVEWYKISQMPGEYHGMYFISKPYSEPTRGVVLLRTIHQACQLCNSYSHQKGSLVHCMDINECVGQL
ncbi:hypothetical protein EDC04DRAFT_2557607 [Pisolithus marmoratus]|nr:hypothetical protein EDC04DRAFT_2557607 [Pisolithus marmoratus]